MLGYFNDIVKAINEADRVQALKDWHADISDTDNGRINRTVIKHDDSNLPSNKRKTETMLDIIMAGVSFQQQLEDTRKRVIDISNQHEALQQRIEVALSAEKRAMDRLLNDAVILPKGDRAFMTDNGFAVTQDGEKIDQALSEGIDWTGKPTLNDYLDQKERLETIEGISNDADQIGVRIGDAQNRLADDPVQDDLDDINIEFDDIQSDIDDLSGKLDRATHNSDFTSSYSNQVAVDLSGIDLN